MKQIVRLLAIVCVTQTLGLFAGHHHNFSQQKRPFYGDQNYSSQMHSQAWNRNNQLQNKRYRNDGIIRDAENTAIGATKDAVNLAEGAVEAPVRALRGIFGGR